MFPLVTHFGKLLSNLQPPLERLKAAETLPSQVRDYLKDCKKVVTIEPHTRLVGSYAQHLCVDDVKDVDILVRVDGDPDNNKPEAKVLIRDLKLDLDELPKALGYEGYADMADVEVERARRSIHVYFKDRDFHLDIVPCIVPDGFEKKLFVPDRGFNKWIPSHPVGYIDLLNSLNAEHGSNVKPLIRLLKHFRNYHFHARKPKSYWLGALTVGEVQEGLDTTKSLAEAFYDLLNRIYERYDHLLWTSETAVPHLDDPVLGHDIDISWNWGRTHFETFMRRVDEGRKWAANALDAQEREEAIGWWQKVFGAKYFPSDISKDASGIARDNRPGIALVDATGRVVSHRTQSGVYTPTKGTTFHGDL